MVYVSTISNITYSIGILLHWCSFDKMLELFKKNSLYTVISLGSHRKTSQ